MLRATDAYGNTTTAPIAIEVYAPIPSIQNVSPDGTLSGTLDEALSQEPVDIFRIREGSSLIPLFS